MMGQAREEDEEDIQLNYGAVVSEDTCLNISGVHGESTGHLPIVHVLRIHPELRHALHLHGVHCLIPYDQLMYKIVKMKVKGHEM